MPIANCIFEPDVDFIESDAAKVVVSWAKRSDTDSSEMTMMFTRSDKLIGKQYAATCYLSLPSIWSQASVSKLQLGLAKAICESFSLDISKVIVITTIIDSGFVVENGREVHW